MNPLEQTGSSQQCGSDESNKYSLKIRVRERERHTHICTRSDEKLDLRI